MKALITYFASFAALVTGILFIGVPGIVWGTLQSLFS